jgi:hypothetical protein
MGTPTYHDDIQVVAGDTWTINGTLEDENGAPIDLTGQEVLWVLLDPDGYTCPLVGSAVVTIVSPPTAGNITIVVPYTATEVVVGRYFDAVRLASSTGNPAIVNMQWTGCILVGVDPFNQPLEPDVALSPPAGGIVASSD